MKRRSRQLWVQIACTCGVAMMVGLMAYERRDAALRSPGTPVLRWPHVTVSSSRAWSNSSDIPEGALRLRQMQAAHAVGQVVAVDSTRVFPPGNENEACVGYEADRTGVVAAVVTMTFNRTDYLSKMLHGLLQVWGSSQDNRRAFPLFISQDFADPQVQDIVYQFLDSVKYLQHVERVAPEAVGKGKKLVYYRIANHYKFVFKTFFDCFGYGRLIVLEDDMLLSPDIFSYFEALAPVLDADPTLYCVSSWNDHGQDRFVRDSRRLYRTDFFPGLGWMTNRATWDSIKDKWPRGYWDDWMRLPWIRNGRQCIRPEICRNYNFGEEGSSQGQFYDDFLKTIRMNTDPVPWKEQSLSYLEPSRYARDFHQLLTSATEMNTTSDAWTAPDNSILCYNNETQFQQLAAELKLMSDCREGTLRAAYKDVITVRNGNGALLFVAPSHWQSMDW